MKKIYFTIGFVFAIAVVIASSIIFSMYSRSRKEDQYQPGMYFIHTVAQVVLTNDEDSTIGLVYYNVNDYQEPFIHEIRLVLDDGTEIPAGYDQRKTINRQKIYDTKELVIELFTTNFEAGRFYHIKEIKLVSEGKTKQVPIGDVYVYRLGENEELNNLISHQLSYNNKNIHYTIINDFDEAMTVHEITIMGETNTVNQRIDPKESFETSFELPIPDNTPYRMTLMPLITYEYDGEEIVTTVQTILSSSGNHTDKHVVSDFLKEVSLKKK